MPDRAANSPSWRTLDRLARRLAERLQDNRGEEAVKEHRAPLSIVGFVDNPELGVLDYPEKRWVSGRELRTVHRCHMLPGSLSGAEAHYLRKFDVLRLLRPEHRGRCDFHHHGIGA